MASYISSNNNRFYVASEDTFATVAAISGQNRIPAVKLSARQKTERRQRRDKTGGRTFIGMPAGLRRTTSFDLTTYLTGWADQSNEPGYGPLFGASLGGDPLRFGGGTVASADGTRLTFMAPHGLTAGQAVTFGGELRFVTAIVDATGVVLNAEFTNTPQAGAGIGATITYAPATQLKSASIFDYWDPATSVQRVVSGAVADKLRIAVNGDFHQFEFSGPAADLLDSSSFSSGLAGLTQFPTEPAETGFDYTIIPGHLGQVWLGVTPSRFHTLTSGDLTVNNNVDLRNREFGSDQPRAIVPGMREVSLNLSLYEQDDDTTKALYQAAKQRSPVSAMFQLGQQQGQLCGMYLPGIVPEVPEFDDKETRLQWHFQNNRAQGTINDEVFIAFG